MSAVTGAAGRELLAIKLKATLEEDSAGRNLWVDPPRWLRMPLASLPE